MASAVSSTINHGVALIIGFVMALILQEVVSGQFDTGILSIVADNIVVLYIVLVLALFATNMSGDATRGGAPM